MNGITLIVAVAFSSCAALAANDSLDQWAWRNPLPTGDNIWSVAFGSGRFVALGGGILDSTGGLRWETSHTGPPIYLLTYGNGQFVGFTHDGSSATSVDGINWVNHPSQNQFWPGAMAYGNQLYVAVEADAVATSVDGITWTPHSLTTAGAATSMAYGNGHYVAVGYDGLVMRSSDGTNWVQQQSGTKNALYSIVYGGGQFVAVGNSGHPGSGTVLTSIDGIVWTSHSSLSPQGLGAVGYGNGLYIAVGGLPAAVFISRDAMSWTQQLSGPLHNLWGVAYGGGTFVVVGESGTIFSSADGTNWISGSMGSRDFLGRIFYGGGKYLLFGSSAADGSATMMVSTNGVNWDQVPQGTVPQVASGIAYGNQQFVLVGTNIATSPDGLNWTARHSPSVYFSGVCYGDGLFVATSGTDAFVTSPDGVNWTSHPSGTTNVFYDIAYGNGQFVAVGSAGTIATSRDTVSWAQQNSGTPYGLGLVVYGNGRFVALARLDRTATAVVTSTDGTNWSGLSYLPKLNSLTFGNGQFVAVGDDCCGFSNPIMTSTDGQNWVLRRFVGHYLWGVCYGDGHFVAVGDEGTILESGDIVTLAVHPQAGQNSLSLSLVGPSGRIYAIQHSTDLISWNTVTNVAKMQPEDLIFPAPLSGGQRAFYRAFSQ